MCTFWGKDTKFSANTLYESLIFFLITHQDLLVLCTKKNTKLDSSIFVLDNFLPHTKT